MMDAYSGEVFTLDVLQPEPKLYDEHAFITASLSFAVPGNWVLCVNYDTSSLSSSSSDLTECDMPGQRPLRSIYAAVLSPGVHTFAAWLQRPPHRTGPDGRPMPLSRGDNDDGDGDDQRLLYVEVPYSTATSSASCSATFEHDESLRRVASKKWHHFVSLGSDCSSALTLRELGLRSAAFPFDWTNSNPMIILDVLRNGWEKAITFNHSEVPSEYGVLEFLENCIKMDEHKRKHTNQYGMGFHHYFNISSDEVASKFNRYYRRLFDLLKSSRESILFLKTAAEYRSSSALRARKDEYYGYLVGVSTFIEANFPHLDFHILNVEPGNMHQDTARITNVALGSPTDSDYMDNCEKHGVPFPFRRRTTELMRCIAGGKLASAGWYNADPEFFAEPNGERDTTTTVAPSSEASASDHPATSDVSFSSWRLLADPLAHLPPLQRYGLTAANFSLSEPPREKEDDESGRGGGGGGGGGGGLPLPHTAACVVAAEKPYSLELLRVFPHALQAQLACWSLFRRFLLPRAHHSHAPQRKVILLPESVLESVDISSSWEGAAFSAGMMRLIGVGAEDILTTATRQTHGESLVSGTVVLNNTGWRGAENPWLVDTRGVEELQQRLGLSERTSSSGERGETSGTIRVGIINRRKSRRILPWIRLADAFSSHSSEISVSAVDDLGYLSFRGAAEWVHSQDVIVTPHGGQNVNLMWVRPCTAVLEVGVYVCLLAA